MCVILSLSQTMVPCRMTVFDGLTVKRIALRMALIMTHPGRRRDDYTYPSSTKINHSLTGGADDGDGFPKKCIRTNSTNMARIVTLPPP